MVGMQAVSVRPTHSCPSQDKQPLPPSNPCHPQPFRSSFFLLSGLPPSCGHHVHMLDMDMDMIMLYMLDMLYMSSCLHASPPVVHSSSYSVEHLSLYTVSHFCSYLEKERFHFYFKFFKTDLNKICFSFSPLASCATHLV